MVKKRDFKPDFYRRLYLHGGAEKNEIRAAYRLLARRYHPDANPDQAMRTRFLGIQQAYEVLADPKTRAAYDEWLTSLPPEKRPILQVRQTLGPPALSRIDTPQAATLLLDLRTDPAARPARLPLNLCLVVDRSSSMRGPRLKQVRCATKEIISQLEPNDVFSLITFSDRATTVLPAHRQLRKEVAKSLVDAVKASGGTEIFQGLNEGMNQALRYHEPNTLTHILLLTDGHTYGDVDECLQLAQKAARRHIAITALGIGSDWNDQFLDALARTSHGTATYIAGPTQVLDTFQAQLSRLRAVACRGVTLSLAPDPDVEVRGAYLVSPEVFAVDLITNEPNASRVRTLLSTAPPDRARLSCALGGLSFEQPTVVLLELAAKTAEPGVRSLLDWQLEVDLSPLGRGIERRAQEVLADVREQGATPSEIPEVVIAAQSRLTAYKLRRKAWQDIEAGHPQQASQRLQGVATRLFDLREDALATAALAEAEHIARTGSLTRDRGKWIKYGTRLLALPSPGDAS